MLLLVGLEPVKRPEVNLPEWLHILLKLPTKYVLDWVGRHEKIAETGLVSVPELAKKRSFNFAEHAGHHITMLLAHLATNTMIDHNGGDYWAQCLMRQPTCSCQTRCISTDVAAGGRPIRS